MKKYKFTGEQKRIHGIVVNRIVALKNFDNIRNPITGKKISIKKGELGGWIEKEENLLQDGTSWVSDEACVYGNASVKDDAYVWGDVVILGNSIITENADVSGNAVISHNAVISGNASVSGGVKISGVTCVTGNAKIYDYASIMGNAMVYGDARVFENAIIKDYAVIMSDAMVSGNAKISGKARVMGEAQVNGNATVRGDAQIYGNCIVTDNSEIAGDTHIFGEAKVSDCFISAEVWIGSNAEILSNKHIFIADAACGKKAIAFYRGADRRIYVSHGAQGEFIWTKEEFAKYVEYKYNNSRYKKIYMMFVQMAEELLFDFC